MSPFDDSPVNFIVYEDNVDTFPCLNSVYTDGPFGTTVGFKVLHGMDFAGGECIAVNTMSITFMKEYKNKSFEELRLEDYLCDRKGMRRFEEKGYSKCFSYTPRSITSSCSLTQLDKPLRKSIQSSVRDDMDIGLDVEGKTVKERSFFTNAETFISLKGKSHSFHSQFNEEPARSFDSEYNDDIENKNLVRDRIQTFFEKCPDEYSPLPSEFFIDNPNNIHFMPCYDTKLAYGRMDDRSRIDWLYDVCFAEQQSRIFGSCEPTFKEGSLYRQFFDVYRSKLAEKEHQERLREKYKLTTLRREYFEKTFCPYDPLARCVHTYEYHKSSFKDKRTWTAKTHLLGNHPAE